LSGTFSVNTIPLAIDGDVLAWESAAKLSL